MIVSIVVTQIGIRNSMSTLSNCPVTVVLILHESGLSYMQMW